MSHQRRILHLFSESKVAEYLRKKTLQGEVDRINMMLIFVALISPSEFHVGESNNTLFQMLDEKSVSCNRRRASSSKAFAQFF